MTKKMMIVLLTLIAVAAAVAVGLAAYVLSARGKLKKTIRVNAEGVTEETLAVSDLSLLPGESVTYTLSLVCAAEGDFYVRLIYTEKEDGGLKDFVNVTVGAEGNDPYTGSLKELLAGETPCLTLVLEREEYRDVTITYTVPEETGNGMQGAWADLSLTVQIERKL